MRIPAWLQSWHTRLVQPPGSVVDLAELRAALPEDGGVELSDAELTARFLALAGTDLGPEMLALARAAAERALGLRPYDEQLLGVQALVAGRVVQMATGEGKTLVAALAAAVLAARGPVQVLTVNDYLARRDAEWMAPVLARLGRRAGWVSEACTPEQRRAAYRADVTYVSVSEAGFDFLRDGLCTDPDQRVQGPLGAVIVDEADSVLVDEARVPLVLAGATGDEAEGARAVARVVAALRPGEHYTVAAQERVVHLTSAGATAVEQALGVGGLYDAAQADLLTAVNLALHARAVLARDVDYIVRDGRVDLVDEFRGRVARRRRWPDGLHAAVEAKEELIGSGGGEILATITLQAFVGCYPHVAGMTGTALGVGQELREFYGLEVAVVPPHRPCVRQDLPDRVFTTRGARDAAVLHRVREVHATGQPVLLATASVAESERFGALLAGAGVPARVLNARHDATEAAIVAEAGAYGAVTVSTQMTGRGVDICLGGSRRQDHDRVAALGGLCVLGVGLHEASRIDDQLRGRAGRQGDPGTSQFFVSLQDDLVLRYAPPSRPRLRPDPAGELTEPAARVLVPGAQRYAEVLNLEVHRHTWRYHHLLEQHRQSVAALREEVLTGDRALRLLRERCPAEYAELTGAYGTARVTAATRAIMLHHLDAAWADHLGATAELRESIHLRAFANLDPVDEFHRETLPLFRALLPRVEQRSTETFQKLDLADPAWTVAHVGLDRPSATWTYVADDTAFAMTMANFFAGVVRFTQGGWKAAKNRG
jgi:preprotein translocase subunit SecA